jgi:hypothetical protein
MWVRLSYQRKEATIALLLSLMLRESKPCGGDVSCMYYYIFSAS